MPLVFSHFTDPACSGIAGGPTGAVNPGASATWTCEHELASPGEWTNAATVEASNGAGTETSNSVTATATKALTEEFTVQKLQRLAGEYTASELTGVIGETVHYEIVVTDTGTAPITISQLTDPGCVDLSGPAVLALAPGESTSATCEHVLTQAGRYTNSASVEAAGRSEQSNEVTVKVPVTAFTVEKLQRISGEYTTGNLEGLPGETVDYEIRVSDTGETPIMLESITDGGCTDIVGPTKSAIVPGKLRATPVNTS